MIHLKEYAQQNNVPIISDEGRLFLEGLIKDENLTSVLEIGTAIGYSALFMAPLVSHITTIERDPKMIKEAVKNFSLYDHEKKITLIEGDALDVTISNQTFDLIFIDAAKAQYEKFFLKYVPLLSEKGVVVCDNLNFHNLDPNKVSRGTRNLIKKLNAFKEFLKNNKDYHTDFFDDGDGMSITRKIT